MFGEKGFGCKENGGGKECARPGRSNIKIWSGGDFFRAVEIFIACCGRGRPHSAEGKVRRDFGLQRTVSVLLCCDGVVV
jgi:hypothetical protein